MRFLSELPLYFNSTGVGFRIVVVHLLHHAATRALFKLTYVDTCQLNGSDRGKTPSPLYCRKKMRQLMLHIEQILTPTPTLQALTPNASNFPFNLHI